MQDYTYHIDTIILQTTARQVCRFAQAHTNSCSDHGADIQPQSQQPCPKLCVRKVSPWEKKKKGKVDRWRASNEMETSRSMKRRGGRVGASVETSRKRVRKRKRERGKEGNKKNSLSPVFHQGRNYTFTKVFS